MRPANWRPAPSAPPIRNHLDLRYGKRERNPWDLFPQPDPDAPCIVFIHGGYWQRNSKEQFANLIAGPHAHGWSAALPGYTLAPDASLTDIVAEIYAALDWLAAHGPAHGIDGPVVLSGWSAGGHLTAMCLGSPSGQGRPGDLRHLRARADPRHLSEREAAADRRGNRHAVAAAAEAGQQAAGLRLRHRRTAALMSDSQELHAIRSAAHLPGALIPVPHANHFTIVHELRDQHGEPDAPSAAAS